MSLLLLLLVILIFAEVMDGDMRRALAAGLADVDEEGQDSDAEDNMLDDDFVVQAAGVGDVSVGFCAIHTSFSPPYIHVMQHHRAFDFQRGPGTQGLVLNVDRGWGGGGVVGGGDGGNGERSSFSGNIVILGWRYVSVGRRQVFRAGGARQGERGASVRYNRSSRVTDCCGSFEGELRGACGVWGVLCG